MREPRGQWRVRHKQEIGVFDKVVLIVGAAGPLMNIPQIIKIFSTQHAADVSLISWLAYTIYDIPWIIYGFIHRDKAIVTAYVLWFLMNSIVVAGVLFYGS